MSNEFPSYSIEDAPIWHTASGTYMVSSHGTKYIDAAMLFGSNIIGHGFLENAKPVGAIRESAAPGLGDLYTNATRMQANSVLCKTIAEHSGLDSSILRSLILHSGSEAVETAIKTALLHTGRKNIVACEGAYHGTFGLALAATHSPRFKTPFAAQYSGTVRHIPYPAFFDTDNPIDQSIQLTEDDACLIVEPILGRGGIVFPSPNFLEQAQAACKEVGALLIVDAVLTGCGRDGTMFKEIKNGADIVCYGKAIGSSAPASAVVTTADIAECWRTDSEVIHTSTHVGSYQASHAIISTLDELARKGSEYENACSQWQQAMQLIAVPESWQIRGTGLMWAVDTCTPSDGFTLHEQLLEHENLLTIPSGPTSSSITLLPSIASVPAIANVIDAIERQSAKLLTLT